MKTIRKNIHWIAILLLLGVLAKHVFILHNIFNYDWYISFSDAIISTVILGLSVWGVLLLIRAYPTTAAITLYALFVALFVSGVTTLAEYETINWWIDEDAVPGYTHWLWRTLPVRFLIIWIFSTWVATIAAFRKNMLVLDARFHQKNDAASLLREAELFKLRQQLQPHFLYNSLNSISALIMVAPDKAQEMIGKLSDFLRSSVRREAEDKIPITEELKYIESYLAIESVRFGDRLHVHFRRDCPDNAMIPPFLVQPVLENAVKFGLYGNTGNVDVHVNISMQGDTLLLSVINPFDPTVKPPRGTGFGLDGIKRRLYLLFARNDLLDTSAEDNIFTTTIKIPQT